MRYDTIENIYTSNAAIHEKLKDRVSMLDTNMLETVPEGEKWSVSLAVEHIAIVSFGIARICRKLMLKAKEQDMKFEGFSLAGFAEKTQSPTSEKLEAPDQTQPTGTRSIEQSIELLSSAHADLAEIKELFETYDVNQAKFPHPYFGRLSAVEWLVLLGQHELRHLKQIERLLGQMVN